VKTALAQIAAEGAGFGGKNLLPPPPSLTEN
jgi:hypothetical protein